MALTILRSQPAISHLRAKSLTKGPRSRLLATTSRTSRPFTTQAGIIDRSYEQVFLPPEVFAPKPAFVATAPPRKRNHAYWQHIGIWKDVSEEEFLSYRWQASPCHDPSDL